MLARKALMIGIILIVAVLAASVCLLHVPSERSTPMCKAIPLATTSADEKYPIWSPDGNKIFFKSDDWICVCNPDGSHREKLAEVEGSSVFSPDMKRVFYVKMIIPDNIMWIARNDPKVKKEIKALQDEGALIEDYKVGITDNIANLVVVFKSPVPVATEERATKEKTYVLDIYIDLINETVIKVERTEKAKVPTGEEKVIYQAYVMDIDGKNREKIAGFELEQKYVDGYVEGDWSYIGSTNIGSNRRGQYEMCSWNPDRTKIFFTKLEETGYTWVWSEEEGKWLRYKAGTESYIPVVQEKGWGELRLIAKEHERTAWIWDLKENELSSIGHLSYGLVTPEEEVVWSSDGKYVALPCSELSEAGATEQIFVINVETGECERLTSFVGSNTWPEWSPDGKRIMYVRSPPEYWWSPSMGSYYDEGVDIYVVDIDGSNGKQLTDISKNREAGCWSPDGSKIAYLSWREGDHLSPFKIWIMNAYGSDKKIVYKGRHEMIADLEWSPDGSKIAFVAWELSEGRIDRDIYVIDVKK